VSTVRHEDDSTEEMSEHVRTYESFARIAKIAAVAPPLFFAFVFYWTR
jgi:hypothetical protein